MTQLTRLEGSPFSFVRWLKLSGTWFPVPGFSLQVQVPGIRSVTIDASVSLQKTPAIPAAATVNYIPDFEDRAVVVQEVLVDARHVGGHVREAVVTAADGSKEICRAPDWAAV